MFAIYKLVNAAGCDFCVRNLPRPPAVGYVKCMELGVKVMARLLKMNAQHLPEDIENKFRSDKFPEEEGYKFTFILPVGPLTGDSLGRLNADFGCAVCGEPSVKRCSRCQLVRYCSSGRFRRDGPCRPTHDMQLTIDSGMLSHPA